MRIIKVIAPIALALGGIVLSARLLSHELSTGALALLALSLTLLFASLIRPMFIRRGRNRAGLPSRYERVKDPWRALDAGEDPTQR